MGSSRDKPGTDQKSNLFLADKSLYDLIQELSERKKMQFFRPIPYVHYRTCTLVEGEVWYIYFYVQDPATGRLKRIRKKLNRISPCKLRRRVARDLMNAIDERLALGWNPLIERQAPKSYTKLFECFDSFLKIKKKEMEKESVRVYVSYVKIIKDWAQKNGFSEDSPCTSFTHEAAVEFMNEVEDNDKISARTYNNYVRFYHGLFKWMADKGYAPGNAFEGIQRKPRRLMKKKRRLFTDAELTRLFTFLAKENKEYLAMCMLTYCCFVRPKELALLRCEDVDLARQTVHIREDVAKNDKSSYRTIPNDLMPYLSRLDLSHPKWFLFGKNEGFDFSPSPETICSRRFAAYWNLVVRPACGFGMDVQYYGLKDTGITNMLGRGVPISFVQQQADHSSVAMTAIYVGKSPSAREELKGVDILPD